MKENLGGVEALRGYMVRFQIQARGIRDPRVLEAMRKIPRDRFIPPERRRDAYDDRPVPIGHGQTISQPYIVAMMTEALELTGIEKVLEVGTGSGYQAAILAELAKEVFTVERIAPLLERALKVLDDLGYTNVTAKEYDGTLGWPEHGPYDAIIVTAGAPKVPYPLVVQLTEGGRLVIPVGGRADQDLIKLTKTNGELIERNLGGCRFVDLIGSYGWPSE